MRWSLGVSNETLSSAVTLGMGSPTLLQLICRDNPNLNRESAPGGPEQSSQVRLPLFSQDGPTQIMKVTKIFKDPWSTLPCSQVWSCIWKGPQKSSCHLSPPPSPPLTSATTWPHLEMMTMGSLELFRAGPDAQARLRPHRHALNSSTVGPLSSAPLTAAIRRPWNVSPVQLAFNPQSSVRACYRHKSTPLGRQQISFPATRKLPMRVAVSE